MNEPSPPADAAGDDGRPAWFEAFLADRGTRKPSSHTMKAYRQDFDAIATLIVGDQEPVAGMPLRAICTDQLRTGFAGYAEAHEAASIRRCWSTWNVLCTYLFTADPMPQVGRPKTTKTLPKALHHNVVGELVAATENDDQQRRSDWSERDRAIILTALLAGLRSEELINSNIGDLRRTADGAVIHVRGKGNEGRRIPIKAALVDVIEHFSIAATTDDRQTPLPHRGTGRLGTESTAVRRVEGRAPDARNLAVPRAARLQESRHRRRTSPRGAGARAASHVRHRARQLRGQRLRFDDLLGHESMSTSQRYVAAAGSENRHAAAQNPLYAILANPRPDTDPAK